MADDKLYGGNQWEKANEHVSRIFVGWNIIPETLEWHAYSESF